MAYYKCGSVYTTQNSNVVVDTASGAIANFQTPLALPLLKTKIDVNAKQDLHGQSGPYPAGGGKNIFSPESPVIVGYIGSSGFSTGNTKSRSTYLKIKPNTTYTVSRIIGQRFVLATSEVIPTNGAPYTNYKLKHDASSITITSGNDDEYLWIYFYLEDTDTDPESKIFASIQVELGSTATSWAPYENICQIEGVSEINAVHCGKNLFNLDYLTASGITIQNGEVSGTAQAFNVSFGANAKGLKNKIRFKANTRYTIKFKAYTDANAETQYVGLKVYFWYTDGNTVSVSCPNNTLSYTDFSVSSNANKTIDYISISYSNGWANTWHLKDIQLEEGSTATDFEPYNGSTTLINLGGTYYGGYVTQDKDGKREFVVTHEITNLGEQTWNYSVWGAGYVFSTNLPAAKDQAASGVKGDIICSIYNNISASEMYNSNPNYSICLNRTNVRITNSDYSNRDTFKVAMNGIMLVYELAEPFTVALPDGQPIKSLPGVNNIFADTGDTSLQFRKIG